MPPRKKRRVALANKSKSQMPTRDSWSGWCEIESDPDFFSTMIQDLGVHDTVVQEVVSLDDLACEKLPTPVYAVIFLFRYKDEDCSDIPHEEDSIAFDNVWFARQVPANACATVALLNTINNAPELTPGAELRALKDATASLSPFEKGRAIANSSFIKNVHNSFARELDMLDIDLSVKNKHDRFIAGRRKQKRDLAHVAKDEANGLRRSHRVVPTNFGTETVVATKNDKDDSTDEDNVFHYITYVPVQDEVWKLNGLKRSPQLVGNVEPDDSWLTLARNAIRDRMEGNDIGFNVMIVVPSPVVVSRNHMATILYNIREVEKVFEQRQYHDWHRYDKEDGLNELIQRAHTFGVTDEQIQGQAHRAIETVNRDSESLRQYRWNEADCLLALLDDMPATIDQEVSHRYQAMLRRHDYKPFFTAWVKALREQDSLDTLKAQAIAQV